MNHFFILKYIKTITFFCASLLCLTSIGQNVVINPGFENGTNNWVSYTDNPAVASIQIDNSIYRSGTNSLKCNINNTTNLVTTLGLQFVPLKKQSKYKLEGYIKTLNVVGQSSIVIEFFENNKRIFSDGTFRIRGTTNGWQKVELRFYLPNQIDSIKLIPVLVAKNGTAWFDDISIVELTDTSAKQLSVNLNQLTGKTINTFGGINSGPLNTITNLDYSVKYQEMGVNFIRTHDVPGDACDISRIFPDFNKSPFDSTAYNFGLADTVIKAMKLLNADVLFRFGESGSNDPNKYNPPVDYDKWAQVCVQIVKHYNQGWNKGFNYNIKHFEIYNEPDIPVLWKGTHQDYIRLYRITSKKLKAYDPSLKIIGPVTSSSIYGFMLLEEFMDSVQTYNLPVDYISYHHYNTLNPYNFKLVNDTIHKLMAKYGLSNLKTMVTEWSSVNFDYSNDIFTWLNDPFTAVSAISALNYFQHTGASHLFHYRADGWELGLIDEFNNYKFNALTYLLYKNLALVPNELYSTGSDSLGYSVLAGVNANNSIYGISIANNSAAQNSYALNFTGIQPSDVLNYIIYRVDSFNYTTPVSTGIVTSANPTLKSFVKAPFSDFIVLQRSVGVLTQSPDKLISIFPNPTSDNVTIDLKGANVKALYITDITGKQIKNLSNLIGNNQVKWDRTTEAGTIVNPGVYFLIGVTDTSNYSFKIILQ